MTLSPWAPETIQTQRLLLRQPRLSDAEDIFRAYAQDADVCRYMVWRPHSSVETVRVFISECMRAWQGGERLPFIITLSGSDKAVGMLDGRRTGGTVDVGYVLERRLWGKGLMPEALRAFTELALAHGGIFRVQASCDVENLASRRVLEKANFRFERRLERLIVHPNLSPDPRACFLFACTR